LRALIQVYMISLSFQMRSRLAEPIVYVVSPQFSNVTIAPNTYFNTTLNPPPPSYGSFIASKGQQKVATHDDALPAPPAYNPHTAPPYQAPGGIWN
jgi:hypothetical protein